MVQHHDRHVQWQIMASWSDLWFCCAPAKTFFKWECGHIWSSLTWDRPNYVSLYHVVQCTVCSVTLKWVPWKFLFRFWTSPQMLASANLTQKDVHSLSVNGSWVASASFVSRQDTLMRSKQTAVLLTQLAASRQQLETADVSWIAHIHRKLQAIQV